MEWSLGSRRGDPLPSVDRTADEGGVRDSERQDGVGERASENGIILVAEGVRVVGPRGPVEVEEYAPSGQLVRLAPNPGFVEESALVVEVGKDSGRDDEVQPTHFPWKASVSI